MVLNMYGQNDVSYKTYSKCGFGVSLPATYKLLQDGETSPDYCDYYVRISDASVIELKSLNRSRFDAAGIEDLYEAALANHPKLQITYKTIRDNWFVISGTDKEKGKIVYWKRVWGDNFVSDLRFEYTEKDKDNIEPYLSKISKLFISL